MPNAHVFVRYSKIERLVFHRKVYTHTYSYGLRGGAQPRSSSTHRILCGELGLRCNRSLKHSIKRIGEEFTHSRFIGIWSSKTSSDPFCGGIQTDRRLGCYVGEWAGRCAHGDHAGVMILSFFFSFPNRG